MAAQTQAHANKGIIINMLRDSWTKTAALKTIQAARQNAVAHNRDGR
jgi:hypothetical protein